MEQLPKDHFTKVLQFTPTVHTEAYPAIDPSKRDLNLHGKVVIVTGASRGIGAKGIVPTFARAGVKALVLVATNASRLESVKAVVASIDPTIETLAVTANIASATDVARLYSEVKNRLGHADALVNNAGIISGGGDMRSEDPDEWWNNFEVNTKAAFLLAQGFINALPTPTSPGTIVNVVTSGAWQIFPAISGYSISKLATMQLMAHLATAYPNVVAIGLHPGIVETDMLLDAFRRFDLSSPELVGGTVAWLCSDAAKFLSGRTIATNWDVEELAAKKTEIMSKDELKVHLGGTFGPDQFVH